MLTKVTATQSILRVPSNYESGLPMSSYKSPSKSWIRPLFLTLVLFLSASNLLGQTSAPAKRKTSTPYTGDLTIFDSPGRDERLQINRVMDILSIHPGSAVADIGAGGGWFSVRAARRVGSTGTVYAVDINPDSAHFIDQRAQKEGLQNIKTIVSKADDPSLPKDAVDSVLMLKTYHEVADPVALMRNLHASLKPDAKVGIIDRNGKSENHGVDRAIVIREMSDAGYQLAQQEDFVKADSMDYFLVFTAKR